MTIQMVLFQNSQVAGLTLLPGALGYALMAIISGRLYDRYGARLPIMIGLVLILIGTMMSAVLPISLYGMLFSFLVIQLGAGFWFGNNMTYAISHVPTDYQSAGNSIFTATNNYSAAVGIALAAGIISIFQKHADSADRLITATHLGATWLFRIDVFLIVLAAIFSVRVLTIVNKKG